MIIARLLFLAVALNAPFTTRSNAQDSTSEYLQGARQSANWLDAVAIKTDSGLIWPQVPAESKQSTDMLYSGNAGVVLFYLAMYRETKEKHYLNQAIAGADSLMHNLESIDQNTPPSFWTGVAGVGYVLSEVYRETKLERFGAADQKCFDHIKHRVKPIETPAGEGVVWNEVTDIIGGSAGIGFYLLDRYLRAKDLDAVDLAVMAGDGLLAVAKPADGEGLKWMMSPTFPREMPNYSHGTAGICDFLLILNDFCNRRAKADNEYQYDGRFLTAAVKGGRYLESLASRPSNEGFIPHHFPEEGPLYYLGWCHGPAGTVQFLNRLARQTGDDRWGELGNKLVDKMIACGIPEQRPEGFWNNVGVCCGNAGVASFMLDRYRSTGDETFLSLAKEMVEDLLGKSTEVDVSAGEKGIYWTHAEHRVRPDFLQAQTGLMQGAAGIGLLLLKIHAHTDGRDEIAPMTIPVSPFPPAR